MLAQRRYKNVIMTAGEGEVVINIPPPVLWGDYPEKEPEEEVKEIPPETGFVVLDRVVIPEYVVVKEGTPSGGGDVYYVHTRIILKMWHQVKFILLGTKLLLEQMSLLYSPLF